MTKRPARKPARPAKPPAKPGRRKAPAVPGHATTAHGAQVITTSDAVAAELTRVRARAASGQRLANHESRILRDAWLIDMALHIWPSLDAAAADLGISPNTLRNYAGEGCPGLEPHSPIPKAPVLAWLLKHHSERGGTTPATTHSIEAVELSIKQAKEAKLWSTLIAEAEDRASQGVIETIDGLRHHLLHNAPAEIATTARDAVDLAAAGDAVRESIENALRACRYQPPRSVTTPATEEAQP